MRRRGMLAGAIALTALAACSREPETADAPAPETAPSFPDPADSVRPIYDPYLNQSESPPAFRDQAPWSADLWRQLEAMVARSNAQNEPILDFDPIIGAQDYELSDLTVTTDSVVENSHAAVRARFTNLGQSTEIVFYMVWENDAWRVDNITGAVAGSGWDLRQISAQPATVAP